jgi:hypothetical protein
MAQFNAVDYFLRAEPEGLGAWLVGRQSRLIWLCVMAVLAGAGVYGAVVGSWWAPLQAFYVLIKLPMLILLTTLGNGLLNAMLAPLLGLNISFRQSLTAVLVSFAYAALILGALSPVALFVIWNTPSPSRAAGGAVTEHAFLQLMLVAFIAFAGVVGNVRLLPLLRQLAGNRRVALRVLLAWLVGNLFLGSQICWVLRPFIGDPGQRVVFLTPNCLQGNFYETVFLAARRVIFGT